MASTSGSVKTLGLRLDASGMVTGGAQSEQALRRVGQAAKETQGNVNELSGLTRAVADAISASTRGISVDLLRLGTNFAEAFTSLKAIEKFVDETSQAQYATAQLTAAVQSTGGAAGKTVAQLEAYAEALQHTTIYSDDAVKGAEAILLTFDKIKGTQFDQAIQAVTDLAARMGGDLTGAALQLGKALQDPEQGMEALRRAGVIFTQSQQDTIKALFDTGKAAEAQTLILQQVEHAFGGAADAARNTLGGALQGLKHDFDDLFKSSTGGTSGIVSAIHALDDALVAIKPHMGELVTVATGVAAVLTARWLSGAVESLEALTQKFIVGRAASAAYLEQELRLAEAKSATTAVELRQAEVEATIARERAAEVVTTPGASLQERAAAINVVAATTATLTARSQAAAVATEELTAAQAAMTVGSRAAAGAMTALNGALALVGGLPGLAILAALFVVKSALEQQGEAAKQAASDLDVYRNALTDISVEAKRTQLAVNESLVANIEAQQRQLQSQIDAAKGAAVESQPRFASFSQVRGVAPPTQEQQQLGALTDVFNRNAAAIAALTTQNDALTKSLAASGDTVAQVGEKFKQMVAEHQAQIDKLRALNAAYGQSDNAIKLLSITLDGNIERLKAEKDAIEAHLSPQQTKVLLDKVEEETALKLTAARLEQQKALEDATRAYTAANAAAVTAAANELQVATATNASAAAQEAAAARVAHLTSVAKLAVATGADYAAASQAASAADRAAVVAQNDREASLKRVQGAQQADVEAQAAYVKFLDDARKVGVDAAAQEYRATTQRIEQVRALRDAEIDAGRVATNAQDASQRVAAQTAYADSIALTIANLNRETQQLGQDAAAQSQGKAAVDALAVARAGDAAVLAAQNTAVEQHRTLTDADADALRKAAEAHEQMAQRVRDTATQEGLALQVTKNFLRELQSDVGNFFADLFKGGDSAAERFWNSFRDLAIKTFADLASQDLMRSLVSHLGTGDFAQSLARALGVSAASGEAAPTERESQVAQILQAGVPGIQVIGQPTTPATTATPVSPASAGSASAAGSAGTAATFAIAYAGVTLVTDGLNKLIGAAGPKSRAELDQWVASFLSLNQSIVDYVAVGRSSADQALADNKAKADALREQTEQVLAGKRLEQERERQLAAINAAEDARNQKIAADVAKSLASQVNALNGPAGAYANAQTAIEQQYQDNVAAAEAAFSITHDLTALFKALADSATILAKAEQQLRAAEADRVAAEADRVAAENASLDARAAAAQGLNHEADVIKRRDAERHELFLAEQQDLDQATKDRIAYVQALEDEAAALQARNDANAALATNTAAGPQGTLATQQAAALQPLLDQLARDTADYNAAVTQLSADQAAGASQAIIDADKYDVMTESIKVSGDQAAITAQKFKDAAALMQQATSQIEKDVSLGFTTPSQGLAYEAQQFGFTGLTLDQIRALYTPFTGAPLTNDQIQTNQNVETYINDFNKWSGQVTDTLSAMGKSQASNAERNAVVNGAQALTDQVGNRMADTLLSIYVDIHRIRELEESGGSVFRGSLENLTNPAPLTGSAGSAGSAAIPPSSSFDLASANRFSATVPFFNPEPILPPASSEDIVTQLAAMLAGGTARTQPAGTEKPAVTINIAAGAVQAPVTVTGPVTGPVSGTGTNALAAIIGDTVSTSVLEQLARRLEPAISALFAQQLQSAQLRDGNPTKPY